MNPKTSTRAGWYPRPMHIPTQLGTTIATAAAGATSWECLMGMACCSSIAVRNLMRSAALHWHCWLLSQYTLGACRRCNSGGVSLGDKAQLMNNAHLCSFVCLQVSDMALEDYIAVKPKFARYVPHTAGRYQKKRFRKAQCPIVERWAPFQAQT